MACSLIIHSSHFTTCKSTPSLCSLVLPFLTLFTSHATSTNISICYSHLLPQEVAEHNTLQRFLFLQCGNLVIMSTFLQTWLSLPTAFLCLPNHILGSHVPSLVTSWWLLLTMLWHSPSMVMQNILLDK